MRMWIVPYHYEAKHIWVLQWDPDLFWMSFYREFNFEMDEYLWVNAVKMSLQNELYFYEVFYTDPDYA